MIKMLQDPKTTLKLMSRLTFTWSSDPISMLLALEPIRGTPLQTRELAALVVRLSDRFRIRRNDRLCGQTHVQPDYRTLDESEIAERIERLPGEARNHLPVMIVRAYADLAEPMQKELHEFLLAGAFDYAIKTCIEPAAEEFWSKQEFLRFNPEYQSIADCLRDVIKISVPPADSPIIEAPSKEVVLRADLSLNPDEPYALSARERELHGSLLSGHSIEARDWTEYFYWFFRYCQANAHRVEGGMQRIFDDLVQLNPSLVDHNGERPWNRKWKAVMYDLMYWTHQDWLRRKEVAVYTLTHPDPKVAKRRIGCHGMSTLLRLDRCLGQAKTGFAPVRASDYRAWAETTAGLYPEDRLLFLDRAEPWPDHPVATPFTENREEGWRPSA